MDLQGLPRLRGYEKAEGSAVKFRIFSSDHDINGDARPLVTAADIKTADVCAVALATGDRIISLVDYSHYADPELIRIYYKGQCTNDLRM